MEGGGKEIEGRRKREIYYCTGCGGTLYMPKH